MRAERCAEESRAEDEVRRKGERIVAEELEEILARTPMEGVWKSFEKVRQKWELEAMAAAEREKRAR